MRKLLIATRNEGKLQEISKFLSDLSLEIVSLTDLGIAGEVEEDGKTYEANAKKKALFYAKRSGIPAIADDGGLEIAALDNAPGVRSKRWIGEDATEEELVLHMKNVAKELPDTNRKASFVNVIAFALPTVSASLGQVWTARGSIEGIIAKKPLQEKSRGLPYRLFFFLPNLGKYYHEKSLSAEEMLNLNHRRRSVEAIKPFITQHLLEATN